MSYQALLFCPDVRLARVVTQVFSELDFTVELVNEPFAAVKKLMAQRYDAVVVDCENEPNATLLFKSARNSSSNQSSLALALVEGQSGVAKAYRIGANLVLTKPLNVEQAKGTLRVARGLLRKNSDAAAASSPAPVKAAATVPTAVPTPAPIAFKAVIPPAPPMQTVKPAPAQSGYEHNAFESELPAMAASGEAQKSPIASPVAEVRTKVLTDDSPARSTLPSSLFEAAQPTAPAFKSAAVTPASSGAASAPAPARESATPIEIKPEVVPGAERAVTSDFSFAASSLGSTPTFSALEDQDSDGSGGSKKLLVIAAVVLIAAALGYFGLTKFGKTSSPSQPASVQAPIAAGPAAPASSVPVTSPLESTGSASQPAVASSSNSKPSASISTPTIALNTEPEVVTKKIAPAIVVKSNPSVKPAPAQSEESAPQVPNPLAVATTSNKNLSGLVSSVPSALPTATLGTLKISQGVSQGLLIKRVQPRYPQTALSMRVQGAVQMEATINKEGNITNLKVISGDPVLAHAAAEAVKQWRYKPYYLNGEPVEIQTQITVNFKLPN